MKAKLIPTYLVFSVNLLIAIIFVIPFFWTVSTSFKPRQEAVLYPPQALPAQPTLHYYEKIFFPDVESGDLDYVRMIVNSAALGFVGTVVTCFLSALAGYAFSIRKFRGRNIFFYIILAAMLIPYQALLVPLFSEMNSLRLIDNPLCLLLIYITFFQPLGIFIMKNTFSAVPKALHESAQMDGVGEWTIFSRIYLPNAGIGLVTVAVFTSAAIWNEFLMALVFMISQKNYTLPVGLNFSFQPPFQIEWGQMSAISVILFIPTITIFIALRKYFIQGVTAGALSAE